jgi:hypothetical protein
MWLEKRLFLLHYRPLIKLFQVVTYSLRGDKLVGHILKSLGHLHCIISLTHANNSLGITNISRSELKRTTTRGLCKLRTILGMKPRDGANAQTSEVVDLMARSASIKQNDDTSVLSKGERLHGMFRGIETLEHFIFIPKDEPITWLC